MNVADRDIIQSAKEVITVEAECLLNLASSIGLEFSQAINAILTCSGRVVVVGMGKSGHVGKKIAATLASTGTPALFVHPAEASHGDLGMISVHDIVVAISKSGESPELRDTLVYCRRFGIKIIAITADAASALGKAADHILKLPDATEACPLDLAPTSSTTATMALGDAIAIALLKARDFKADQFREYHPGGKLGQKLTRVEEVMHGIEMLPLVEGPTPLSQAVMEMSKGRFGCVGVVDGNGLLVGIFTDGDLRRSFSASNFDKHISDLMTPEPYSISRQSLIADVAKLFSDSHIPSVFVCEDKRPVGIIHVHDLLKRGSL